MPNINRFLEAQESTYEIALKEIKEGRKRTHWIWYIFPQIKGLGYSSTSIYYGIESLEEAACYISNPILRSRLYEITEALLNLNTSDIEEVLGSIDALKVKSSMTLFYYVTKDEIFKKVIDKYYDSIFDTITLNIIESMQKEKHL